MGNESSTSIFEGPPPLGSSNKENSGKKKAACDEETAVYEIVGTLQSTIVCRSQSHSSRNAVNVSFAFLLAQLLYMHHDERHLCGMQEASKRILSTPPSLS